MDTKMAPAEFKRLRVDILELSAQRFAVAIGRKHGRLVRRWESGETTPIPAYAVLAMRRLVTDREASIKAEAA
jgi:DNA-binding transcriptional regulator YiaG